MSATCPRCQSPLMTDGMCPIGCPQPYTGPLFEGYVRAQLAHLSADVARLQDAVAVLRIRLDAAALADADLLLEAADWLESYAADDGDGGAPHAASHAAGLAQRLRAVAARRVVEGAGLVVPEDDAADEGTEL